jgi:hypothetical protein
MDSTMTLTFGNRAEAVQLTHRQIHQRHVRQRPLDQFHRFFSIPRLAHHFRPRDRLDQRSYPRPHQSVVVSQNNTHLLYISAHISPIPRLVLAHK